MQRRASDECAHRVQHRKKDQCGCDVVEATREEAQRMIAETIRHVPDQEKAAEAADDRREHERHQADVHKPTDEREYLVRYRRHGADERNPEDVAVKERNGARKLIFERVERNDALADNREEKYAEHIPRDAAEDRRGGGNDAVALPPPRVRERHHDDERVDDDREECRLEK